MRGLAIFIVVLNHTIVIGLAGLEKIQLQASGILLTILNILTTLGVYAVPIFLFFAGCYINYALEGRSLWNSYRIIFKTILIVLWPYIIWSILFYMVIYLDGRTYFTLWGYLKNLIVGYPYNFIPILIFYYLLSPILSKFKGYSFLIPICFIAVYQIFLIALGNPSFFGFNLPEYTHIFALPVLHETMRLWAIFFPMGLYVKSFTSMSEPHKRTYIIILSILAIAVLILSYLSLYGPLQLAWINFLVPIPFLLLSVLWERKKIPFLKFLERLGKRSYGLYFMNLIVLDGLVLIFNLFLKHNSNLIIFYFMGLFLVTLVLPVVFMEWVERKLNRKVYLYLFG